MELSLAVGRLFASLVYFACFRDSDGGMRRVRADSRIVLKRFFTNCYNLSNKNNNFFYAFLSLLNDRQTVEDMLPGPAVGDIQAKVRTTFQQFSLFFDTNLNCFFAQSSHGRVVAKLTPELGIVKEYISRMKQHFAGEFLEGRNSSLFDLILTQIVSNQRQIFDIAQPRDYWLFTGLIPEEIKLDQAIAIVRLGAFLPRAFSQLPADYIVSKSGLQSLICAPEFGAWMLGALARARLVAQPGVAWELDFAGAKGILEHLLCVLSVLEQSPLDDEGALRAFIEKGNLGVLVDVMTLVEIAGNCDFDLWESRFGFSSSVVFARLIRVWQAVIFKMTLGLLRLPDRCNLISPILARLTRSLQIIEIAAASTDSTTQQYGPLRSGLLFQLLGLLLFSTFFIEKKDNQFTLLQTMPDATARTKLSELLGVDREAKLEMYRNWFTNQVFYELREAGLKKKHLDQLELDRKAHANQFNWLTWKCLFLLDADLQSHFGELFAAFLEQIWGLQNRSPLVERGMYFFGEIMFGETNLEEFFVSLTGSVTDSTSSETNAQIFDCLIQKIWTFLSDEKKLTTKFIVKKLKMPFSGTDPENLVGLVRGLSLPFASHDKKTDSFTLKKGVSNRKLAVASNLFFTQALQLNGLIARQQTLKRTRSAEDVHWPSSPRYAQVLQWSLCGGILQQLCAFYRRVGECGSDQPDAKLSAKIVDFIIFQARISKLFEVSNKELESFIKGNWDAFDEHHKYLTNVLFFKKEIISDQTQKDKKAHKSRANKLIRKIKKKANKRFEKITLEDKEPDAKANHCWGCQQPLESASSAYLLCQIHKYNSEFVLRPDTPCVFRRKSYMMTTCGHKYHYDCLQKTRSFGAIKCLFCKSGAHVFLPVSAPEDPESASRYVPNGVTRGNEHFSQISRSLMHQGLSMWQLTQGCIEQSLRLVKTIKSLRFENNILPCLKGLISANYFLKASSPALWAQLVKQCVKEYLPFTPLLEMRTGKPQLVDPRRICVESLMVRVVLCRQLESVDELDEETLSEDFAMELISSFLDSNFEDLFPKMVILKMLQSQNCDWKDLVHVDSIVSGCYDLLCLGWLLEGLLNPSVEEVPLPESVGAVKKSSM